MDNEHEIVLQHLTWYPLMGLRDVYKLLFQGVMGSEHLISSPEWFSRYLAEEFASIEPVSDERLLEPLRMDRTLMRINLRPYKSLQPGTELLIPALLETARSFTNDIRALKSTWMDFVESCERGSITRYEVQEAHQFTDWLEGLGFPAIHHSEAYTLAYRPAYRLISAELARRLGFVDAN